MVPFRDESKGAVVILVGACVRMEVCDAETSPHHSGLMRVSLWSRGEICRDK